MKQITSQQLFIGSNTALESMYNNQTEQDYWNSFYSWKDYQDLLKRPSDFAKFSLDFIKKTMSNVLWNLDVEMEEIPISFYTQI